VAFTYVRGTVFCDQGPHVGMHRVDLRLSVYLTDEQARAWSERGFVIAIAPEEMPDGDVG
jgi:hypothetical protein